MILNAQQAMPQGGVVEVRADNLPSEAALPPLLPPGHWIKITIRDQGCGIPADQLPPLRPDGEAGRNLAPSAERAGQEEARDVR